MYDRSLQNLDEEVTTNKVKDSAKDAD